jgi:hypothetical protein
MAQQTAVEWLDNELWKLRLKVRGQEISIDIYFKEEAKLILQAKEMEKQQKKDAWVDGNGTQRCIANKEVDECFDNYYTEVYGKE